MTVLDQMYILCVISSVVGSFVYGKCKKKDGLLQYGCFMLGVRGKFTFSLGLTDHSWAQGLMLPIIISFL